MRVDRRRCQRVVLVPIQMIPVKTPTSKRTRGGARFGAGRKRSKANKYDPSHAKRAPLDFRHPVHAMLRTTESVPWLRQRIMYKAIRETLVHFLNGEHFRVVHISIQQTHVHLIVEASNETELSLGMQRFAIRAARAIRKAHGGAGKVFEHLYEAKQIRDRTYARNALAYVLNNWRRHHEDIRNGQQLPVVFDLYSSAIAFTGWTQPFEGPENYKPLPVSPPRTGLLQSSWQWHGRIDPFEIPGPLW